MLFSFSSDGFLQSLIVLDVEFIHPASIKVRCIMVIIISLKHGVTHTIGSAMLLSCLMCNISAENSKGNMKLNGYVVLTNGRRSTPLFHISSSFLCLPRGQNLSVHVGMLVNMHIKVCTQITAYSIPPIIHFCSTGKERR